MNECVKFGVYTREGEEYPFSFGTSLSAKQKVSFVNNVVDAVVGDNYYDFLTELIFDFEVVEKFTDVDLFDIAESDNQIDAIEKFLYETNIVDIVKENAEFGLIDELYTSVKKCIEYKTGIHLNVIDEALSKLLNTLESKISNIDTDEMMEMARVMSGVSGELTADKIIEAYGKSYVHKDGHKQNVEMQEKHSDILEKDNVVDNEK